MPVSVALKRKAKKLSRLQEEEIMTGIGGHRQAGSGSRPGYKSDGRLYNRVRMEAKYTTSKSYKLNHADLNKIRGECQGTEKPVLILDFKDPFTGRTTDRWAIIEYSEWEKYINAMQDR